MGIRNLMVIIKKHCPENVWNRLITLEELPKPHGINYTRVAVDTSLLMYKYRHASIKVEKETSDIHIIGFINRIVFYLKSNTIPFFVFDGKPPAEKEQTLTERRIYKEKIEGNISVLEAKQEKLEKLEKLEPEQIQELKETKEEIERYKKNLIYVKKEHFKEIRTLLKILGIKYFDPTEYNMEGEAEHICSTYQKKGIVDHVVTDDTDTFVFGATSVIRSAKKGKIQHMYLNDILQGLKLNHDEFIDFCILCGCDYCGTIPKVGPVGAYAAITKFKSIEKWLESKPSIIKEDSKEFVDFSNNYVKAREIFKKEYEYIDPELINLNKECIEGSQISDNSFIDSFKEEELKSFLKNKNWETTTITKTVSKIKKVRLKYDSCVMTGKKSRG
jgi:flap endonuclease-1|tara:strand:- start:600 stop:1763 length:1164 start_codon:yes stop_codon:yes gene_type:complete